VTGRRERRKQLLDRSWIGRILCRNCLLKQVIEGKTERMIEVTGRRERRRKQLLDRSWIGRILCRNCLLKQVIEGKIERRIEVTGRRERMHFSTLLATVRVALLRSSWRSCFMTAALFIMRATDSSLVFTFCVDFAFHPSPIKNLICTRQLQTAVSSHPLKIGHMII